MISIITDADTRSVINTNALLNLSHRLLSEYRDSKDFTTVEIVRYGAGFNGGNLMVRLTRAPDGKIHETWGRQATVEQPGSQLSALPNTTKAS